VNRRDFIRTVGVCAGVLVPASKVIAAVGSNITQDELWTRPREIWITRPQAQESGRFTYWANGAVIEDQYFALCRLMRDLGENKSVAMHIGLLNFQFAIQQGMNFYFGAAPYILTDGFRTRHTNNSIENAAKYSQHLNAAANDGRYERASISDQFKLASWFGVGGVGIYPRHIHVDAGTTRRWAGDYGPSRGGKK
jgi:uncharacterized protein YcbK (DUF882 family)